VWWASLHLELTTKAAYRSNLETHFLPFFGEQRMANILPSHVQAWVNKALDDGLTPRSVVKYHVVLHGIFKQAVRDRVIPFNPAAETKMPKVVRKQRRILTPKEFETLLEHIPDRWLPLVLTSIETGLRWGELVALRPRHIDWTNWRIRIEETALELSKRNSPTGQRIVFKDYPKDDEPRTLAVTRELITVLQRRVDDYGLGPDHLHPSTEGPSLIPVSRNTFRTKVWLPALEEAKLGFPVRMHDLRHAHASWLLAGGADLAVVMERLGHRQIMTTQQYLHTLPDADRKALEAFSALRRRGDEATDAGLTRGQPIRNTGKGPWRWSGALGAQRVDESAQRLDRDAAARADLHALQRVAEHELVDLGAPDAQDLGSFLGGEQQLGQRGLLKNRVQHPGGHWAAGQVTASEST
jgi:integrase